MPCFYPNKVRKYSAGFTKFLGGIAPVMRTSFDGTRQIEHLLPGVVSDHKGRELSRVVNVPCGKCDGCRLDQSRQWAERCVMESLVYPKERSWFVTLTYADDDLGFQHECDINDLGFRNLNSRHPQLFLKSLREKWARVYGDDNIRAFYCGEYGDQSFRCHYHFLLFNIGFYDLNFWAFNQDHDPMYNSEALSSVWPHGYAVVAELNYRTAAYTARYVLKKRKQGGIVDYDAARVVPEFTRMSNRPGIGVPFYELHAEEILRDGKIYIPGPGGQAVAASVPRLFLDRAKVDFPALYADFAARKENLWQVSNRQYLRALPSFDEREYFRTQELEYEHRFAALVRTL